MIIDIDKFNRILKREKNRQEELPEHTLDWYTYSNRVYLLEEVRALFTEEPVATTHQTVVEDIKKKGKSTN